MKCIECGKKIGISDEECPYCGALQYDAVDAREAKSGPATNPVKAKGPMFSEEECLLYGIYPDEEMYRKAMELDILAKKY